MFNDLPSIFSNGEVEGRRCSFNHKLRTHYQQEPEQIIVDDCALLDYLLDRERTARDDKLDYTYVEDGSDIEQLLENSEAQLMTLKDRQEIRWRLGDLPDNIDKTAVRERINKIEASTETLNIEDIKPREGFREFDDVEHHDRVLAEHAYQENAVIATYDDDFLHFPVNYTTPGMLI